MNQIKLTILLLTLLCSGCYKMEPLPENTARHTFSGLLRLYHYQDYPGYFNLGYNPIELTAKSTDTFRFNFAFNAITGDPSNYPIKLSFAEVPSTISIADKSFSFRLNYDLTTFVYVTGDTGTYSFKVLLTMTDTSMTYPVTVVVK